MFYSDTGVSFYDWVNGGTLDGYLTANGWTRTSGTGGIGSVYESTCPITNAKLTVSFTTVGQNGTLSTNIKNYNGTRNVTGVMAFNNVTNSVYQVFHRVKLAVRPGFIYLEVEGPRAGETGAYDAYGSGKAAVIYTTVTPFEEATPEEALPVMILASNGEYIYATHPVLNGTGSAKLATMRPLPQDVAAFGERPETIVRSNGDVLWSPILYFHKGWGGLVGTINNVYFGAEPIFLAGDPTGSEYHGFYDEMTGEDGNQYVTVRPFMLYTHGHSYCALGWTWDESQVMTDSSGSPVILVRKD